MSDLITVPNLSANSLVAEARVSLKLDHVCSHLALWDFMSKTHNERGENYEALVWKPEHDVVPATQVREYFRGKSGFVGRTAAFIAWLIKHKPDYPCASISMDHALFQRNSHLNDPRSYGLYAPVDGGLYAPIYLCGDDYRRIVFCPPDVRNTWGVGISYVAFREVK